ncbi:hypothetical protein Kpol_423p8 [Vanderwaltozyma polyspora DSM 70294]|uniref:Kinesin-like protein n=1 Tax=Vanderwaltozyma polyspora (strain ATCC 22028 / DSM 70294 / BCRC 21397 / CBS 2163 / NBRC 10782 / NRRL Y-8283 / UCD 57-17) TaxID=436907 RepID=A7TR85_VANPO|nr:uncharacterized protein Kpol_423p8 [Vanderwaltozyma polyspora DSM 70294]EDO15218.1 hypothetical protein Kpol_423p8 [Vanderwaltozyma polyspora DSM 70294]
MDKSEKLQSSITVAVRVRPFTEYESLHLIRDNDENFQYPSLGDSSLTLPGSREENNDSNTTINSNNNNHNNNNSKNDIWYTGKNPYLLKPNGIRKIVDCVDEKMLIFDPSATNPLNKLSETVLNSMYSRKQVSRRQLRRNGGEIKFIFDKLFNEGSSQLAVYRSTTSLLLDSVLDGFNGTVFAYGATGCGKTYTISGTPEQPGIIFLAMEELFQKIENIKDTKNFELTLSYLEIYNESIRDLLNPDTPSKKLVIREDNESKISVANLSHHRPKTVQDVMDLIIKGNINRTTSATDANETSSRSHAVLQIHISQTNRTVDLTSSHVFATLSIIDLAGSERAASTKNRGERLYEGANINKSLLALGNCINALCLNDGTRRSCHVPYRDSKLTRLLKFSLGGNCKTVMIVCVSPSSTHYDETLNTLKYANRAKEIKTKVIRNQQSLNRHVGSYLKMITEQKKEIDELRQREQNMIEIQLKKYKLGREKIQLSMDDCLRNIQNTYAQTSKFQNAKNIKSLILCKRRFLQMINLELDSVLYVVNSTQDMGVMETCNILKEQILNKIRELEEQFDTPDELDLVIEHSKKNDAMKLSEMEYWDDIIDRANFESRLDNINEVVRNEVLVNGSMLTEKLFENENLMYKCKFFSKCLYHQGDINESLQELLDIDKEFEQFGQRMFASINFNVNVSKTQKVATVPIASVSSEKKLVKPIKVTKSTTEMSNSTNSSPSPKNIEKILRPIIASKKTATTTWTNSHNNNGQTPVKRKSIRNTSRMSLDPEITDIDVSMQDIYPVHSNTLLAPPLRKPEAR